MTGGSAQSGRKEKRDRPEGKREGKRDRPEGKRELLGGKRDLLGPREILDHLGGGSEKGRSSDLLTVFQPTEHGALHGAGDKAGWRAEAADENDAVYRQVGARQDGGRWHL